jgi:hypothetical protein
MVISETLGVPVMPDQNPEELHAYGLSIEDVIGEGKQFETFKSFFEYCFLTSDQREYQFRVFCDQRSYLILNTVWFKFIFPNIDAESAYKIVRANFLKMSLFGDYDRTGKQKKYYDSIPTKADYINVFNEINIDFSEWASFYEQVKPHLSYEFYMASYLYNGSYKENLKNCLKLFGTRHVEAMLRDLYTGVKSNILNKKLISRVSVRTYNLENAEEILNDPRIADLLLFVREPLIENKESLRLDQLTPAQVESYKEFIEILSYLYDAGEPTLLSKAKRYLEIFSKTDISDEELSDLVAWESDPNDEVRLWKNKDRDNINFYLLDYIFDLKESNQTELIAPFILR